MIFKEFIITFAGVFLIWNAPLPLSQTPRRIDITAKRFSYSPNEITLKKGQPVTLVFHSTDVTHGFKLPELNINSEIHKGKDTEITITPMQTGQFVGKCAHYCGKGHGSMTMLVHVVD